MKTQHLRRTNKLILLLHTITTIFGFMGLMSQLQLAKDMTPIQSIIPMVALLGVYFAGLVFFGFGNIDFHDKETAATDYRCRGQIFACCLV